MALLESRLSHGMRKYFAPSRRIQINFLSGKMVCIIWQGLILASAISLYRFFRIRCVTNKILIAVFLNSMFLSIIMNLQMIYLRLSLYLPLEIYRRFERKIFICSIQCIRTSGHLVQSIKMQYLPCNGIA